MKIDKVNITSNVSTYKVVHIGENFNTYRKLKEIPYYFCFDELYKGVKPVIFVETKFNDIIPYSFNYNEAKEHGNDVVLVKPVDTCDDTSYIYVYKDKDEAMKDFLKKKQEYLQTSKSIMLDEYHRIASEKTIKSIEERERLLNEMDKKINEILDVYDAQLELLNSKVNLINKQIDDNVEMIKQLGNETY